MKIKVAYCRYTRKDGSFNQLTFDTEKKTFTNDNIYPMAYTFIEAYISKDVNDLRRKLIADGYTEVKGELMK